MTVTSKRHKQKYRDRELNIVIDAIIDAIGPGEGRLDMGDGKGEIPSETKFAVDQFSVLCPWSKEWMVTMSGDRQAQAHGGHFP